MKPGLAVLIGVCLAPGLAAAEGETPALPAVAEPMAAGQIVQLLLGLAAVMLLIFGMAWLLRRVTGQGALANGALRIVGGLSMGARERIVLVQVGDTQLLVGVAPGRVQTLHVLPEPLPVETAEQGGAGFQRVLGQVLGGRGAKRS
ncbi:flagellar biosynthetic protein FliO [Thiohalobacter sp.]|uniref:flagellar biosynthetic protein FliO n=1 Tax=Thiohalobacter sp. TaxID=2025948 RepID=UPI002617BD76|nr:flagellar biosynthetic protein FliO [Thiohalobacter sp.]